MRTTARSDCPISHALEVIGDRWSLLILRDVIFADKRSFNQLLGSDERIATNILRDRLRGLVAQGMLTTASDPGHRQKVIYNLTEKSIQLLPTLLHLGQWGEAWLRPGAEEVEAASRLFRAGSRGWTREMERLRRIHGVKLLAGVASREA